MLQIELKLLKLSTMLKLKSKLKFGQNKGQIIHKVITKNTFGNFENPGGVSIFLKCLSGVGGQRFSKMSEIQKYLKCPMGGGSTLFGTLAQIFSFLLVTPPLSRLMLSFA